MLNLNLKNNKFYFLLKFRLIFLNFKYLNFIKINQQEYKEIISNLKSLNLTFIKIKFTDLSNILKYNYFLNYLKNNYILIYSNEYIDFYKKPMIKIDHLSFSGYFINSEFNKKINIYYNYFKNNYNIYLFLINIFIKIFIYIIFLYLNKLIKLFYKIGLKKI